MTINRVCSSCFEDDDLRAWIRETNGSRGCDACGKRDSPTCELSDVCSHIQRCMDKYWGRAVDQLPYNSAEGGYLGQTWDTADILEKIGLFLPRDRNNRLYYELISHLTDDTWCEYDFGTLDHDVALRISWESFCETVKHKRRFFFQSEGTDDRDSFSAASLLNVIALTIEDSRMIWDLPLGTKLWRARTDLAKGKRVNAANFGPPPAEFALQSNRMNPPGIPMLYLASTAKTALKETRSQEAHIGQWTAARTLRVLDLRHLPSIPGIFSDVDRDDRLGLRFLHQFARDIMMPVKRDQRVHIDYLPSQVVTEYFRDFDFGTGKLDGIAYGSTVHSGGWNVALFADEIDLGIATPKWGPQPDPWLRFTKSVRVHL